MYVGLYMSGSHTFLVELGRKKDPPAALFGQNATLAGATPYVGRPYCPPGLAATLSRGVPGGLSKRAAKMAVLAARKRQVRAARTESGSRLGPMVPTAPTGRVG